jgi:hypothetical protein
MMPNEPVRTRVGDKLEEQLEQVKSGVKDLAAKVSGDSSAATRKAPRSRAGTEGSTKEQLYADAKRLGVKGRSKMTKAQLAKAVGRH